jgi:hypothetical protein
MRYNVVDLASGEAAALGGAAAPGGGLISVPLEPAGDIAAEGTTIVGIGAGDAGASGVGTAAGVGGGTKTVGIAPEGSDCVAGAAGKGAGLFSRAVPTP